MNQMVDRKTNSYRIQKPSAAIVKGLCQAIVLFNFDAFLLAFAAVGDTIENGYWKFQNGRSMHCTGSSVS